MANNPEDIEIQVGQVAYTIIDGEVRCVKVEEVYADYCIVQAETQDYCRHKKDLYLPPEETV